MKKRVFLFLIPSFLLLISLLTSCNDSGVLGKSFVSPGRTIYETGESLDLTGGKIVYYYAAEDVSYDITMDMLDSSTIPNFLEAGEFTIKGSYEDFKFEFDITINAVKDLLGKSFVSPGRTLYKTGESLDLTGAKIVYYRESGDVSYDVTMDMLDETTIPDFTASGDYTIKGSYEDFKFEFDITIEKSAFALKDIEVNLKEDLTKYIRSMDVYEYISCREVYSDGTTGDWYDISGEDVDSITIENGTANINLSFFINNEVVKKVINLPVDDECLTVSQLKAAKVGETHLVTGVVVAIASTVSREEVIIADKVTGEIISIGGMNKSGTAYDLTLDLEVEIGDEIIVPVVLENSTLSSDSSKLYGKFTGGSHVYNTVISKNNTINIDYSDALVVDSQADLVDMLSSANRGNNVYKPVKLVGQINFITYEASRHFRFWFEDGNIDNYEDQKIDGNMSPCFCDGTQYYTTGKNFAELVFGDKNFVSEDWGKPATKVVEIYALFIGGNSYYHEFVILDNAMYKELELTNTNTYLVEPENTTYIFNSVFSIEGAKIVREYDLRSDEIIDVTMDMIDPTTIPDFKTEGKFIVKGSYEGFNFEFEVLVENKVVSEILIDTMPSKLVYGHRDSVETLDLTGGKILVKYDNGSHEVVEMDSTMLPVTDEDWKIGNVEYELTYGGKTTTFTVTYENRALTVSEVLQCETGNSYDVTGIIVGPVSSAAAIELLIKDKNSNTTIGIYNSGAAGTASAPNLHSLLNVGDEIIVTVQFRKSTTTGASLDKYNISGKVVDGDELANSVIIVSTGNEVNYDLSNVTVVDTQEKLVNFLNSEDRFYSYVKLVQPKAVAYNTSHLRLFFGDEVTSLTEQKVNGYSPVFHVSTNNVYLPNGITSYFNNPTSKSYSDPATTTNSFYALYVGGNTYYHMFVVLGENFIVSE